MLNRLLKIAFALSVLISTTGFVAFPSLLGPGLTLASSGNVFKAAAQVFIDHEVKNKTGKNSLAYVKEEVKKQHQKNLTLNNNFNNLIEKRVKIVHEKLQQQNKRKDLNKDFIQLVQKRIIIARTKINKIKINQ